MGGTMSFRHSSGPTGSPIATHVRPRTAYITTVTTNTATDRPARTVPPSGPLPEGSWARERVRRLRSVPVDAFHAFTQRSMAPCRRTHQSR